MRKYRKKTWRKNAVVGTNERKVSLNENAVFRRNSVPQVFGIGTDNNRIIPDRCIRSYDCKLNIMLDIGVKGIDFAKFYD